MNDSCLESFNRTCTCISFLEKKGFTDHYFTFEDLIYHYF
ncbi:hypothetical protein T01_3293 [Trichinella spiralis]|uniref:Uncharacterized protein n=1 Tax=Trichinella spiralis TaxID=6334 RepID=A0A0V1AKI0_TRISP|nr:hypothetical protein T01_3293 [Trichinella spiralis]